MVVVFDGERPEVLAQVPLEAWVEHRTARTAKSDLEPEDTRLVGRWCRLWGSTVFWDIVEERLGGQLLQRDRRVLALRRVPRTMTCVWNFTST